MRWIKKHMHHPNEEGALVRTPRSRFAGVALAVLAVLPAGVTRADQGEASEQIEAIFSKTSNGYVRALRADGSFQPETYTFGKAKFWGGDFVDPSIDHMTVDDVAHTVAPALARQSYIAAKDPNSADLFIVINWGTTVAPEYRSMDPEYVEGEKNQMSAHGAPGPHSSLVAGDTGAMDGVINGLQRASLDGSGNTWDLGGPNASSEIATSQSTVDTNSSYALSRVAGLLGAENRMWATISLGNAHMLGYASLADAELQRYRYFVVLLAFDRKTISQKKPKLLWEARLSISQHRNLFDKRLGAMAENASAYFGQNSNGLIHKAVPMGFVRIGQISSLEFPSAADAAAVAGDGTHMVYLKREGSESGIVVVDVDRPDGLVVSRIPASEAPARVAWDDSTHIRVTLTSAEVLAFDINAKSWSTAPAERTAEIGNTLKNDEMQAKVAQKFPHRSVTVLGSDQAGRRYLLVVSGTKGVGRYYLFDSQDDLLVDVGRSALAP
jgi:hypothetical protein